MYFTLPKHVQPTIKDSPFPLLARRETLRCNDMNLCAHNPTAALRWDFVCKEQRKKVGDIAPMSACLSQSAFSLV